jgi:hypothetical protein
VPFLGPAAFIQGGPDTYAHIAPETPGVASPATLFAIEGSDCTGALLQSFPGQNIVALVPTDSVICNNFAGPLGRLAADDFEANETITIFLMGLPSTSSPDELMSLPLYDATPVTPLQMCVIQT